jgi:hypothetical protein
MIERGGEVQLGDREVEIRDVLCVPIQSNLCPLDPPAVPIKFDDVEVQETLCRSWRD